MRWPQYWWRDSTLRNSLLDGDVGKTWNNCQIGWENDWNYGKDVEKYGYICKNLWNYIWKIPELWVTCEFTISNQDAQEKKKPQTQTSVWLCAYQFQVLFKESLHKSCGSNFPQPSHEPLGSHLQHPHLFSTETAAPNHWELKFTSRLPGARWNVAMRSMRSFLGWTMAEIHGESGRIHMSHRKYNWNSGFSPEPVMALLQFRNSLLLTSHWKGESGQDPKIWQILDNDSLSQPTLSFPCKQLQFYNQSSKSFYSLRMSTIHGIHIHSCIHPFSIGTSISITTLNGSSSSIRPHGPSRWSKLPFLPFFPFMAFRCSTRAM